MPTNLKKLVRARMEKTGESHATALRYVRRRAERREASDTARRLPTPFRSAATATTERCGTIPRSTCTSGP